MSRLYSAIFEEVSVTVPQDFFQLTAPADSVVVIHMVEITQSSDAGDKQSEQLSVLVHRGSTDGSGGTSPTPAPLEIGDPVAGTSVEANNTSLSTEGAILWATAFNVMAGMEKWFTPETRPVLSPSGQLNVTLQTTPADGLTMSGTVVFEEIGG